VKVHWTTDDTAPRAPLPATELVELYVVVWFIRALGMPSDPEIVHVTKPGV